MVRQYLFGRPVAPAKPSANGPRQLFVLGAYPSALHVRWKGPDGSEVIKAVAVDNEPEPFWNGSDQDERVERWRKQCFRDSWGTIEACGRLNGSSGVWVDDNVLKPLGIRRQDAWITDCLDTYYESAGAAQRLQSLSVAALVRSLGVPPCCHNSHPSEAEIVRLAQQHMDRLRGELATCQPECVVTLGNAALRVFCSVADCTSVTMSKLSVQSYGSAVDATVHGRRVQWFPLAHPAAPEAYQSAHVQWTDKGAAR